MEREELEGVSCGERSEFMSILSETLLGGKIIKNEEKVKKKREKKIKHKK